MNANLRALLAAAAFLAALPPRAPASLLTISNFSFENARGYGAQSVQPSSWGGASCTPGSSCNGNVLSGAAYTGYQGSNVFELNLDVGAVAGSSGTSWVSATSLGLFSSNSLYTLTVSLAMNGGNAARSAILALSAGAATPTNTVASTMVNRTNLSGAFQDYTVTFNTYLDPNAVGKSVGVLLEHRAVGSQYGTQFAFDNVRLGVITVPEPAAAALLLSLVPAGFFLRRRS
jgi:hypothetical protein